VDRSGPGVDHNTRELTSYADPGGEDEEPQPEARPAPLRKHSEDTATRLLRWAGIFLSHAAALMIGFAVAYLLFPKIIALAIDPLTGQVVQIDSRMAIERLLEQQNEAKAGRSQPAPPPLQNPPAPNPAAPNPAAPNPPVPTPPNAPGSHP
jgi:hypothetical protein